MMNLGKSKFTNSCGGSDSSVPRVFPSVIMKIRKKNHFYQFLPLIEATAFRAVFVVVSRSDGRADGNALGASQITQKR